MADKKNVLNWMKTEADLKALSDPTNKVTSSVLDWLKREGLKAPPGYAFYYGEPYGHVEIKGRDGTTRKIPFGRDPAKKQRGRPGIELIVHAELNWLQSQNVAIPKGNTEAADLVLAHWPDQDSRPTRKKVAEKVAIWRLR
jgi:hypothetical protein